MSRNKYLELEETVENNIQDIYESKESIEDVILKIEKWFQIKLLNYQKTVFHR